MATLTRRFQADTEHNHREHQALLEELHQLEDALDGLVCYSEVFADLGSSQKIYRCGRTLAQTMPQHFVHEESRILDPLAKADPALASFVREMKRQHKALQQKLAVMCLLVEELEDSEDLEQSIDELKLIGREFARQLAGHMDAEEHKLHGFAA